MKLNIYAAARTAAAVQGRLKLARLAEMSEEEFAKELEDLEKSTLFKRLSSLGALTLAEFPAARYAARRYAGYGLKLSAGELPELADGGSGPVELIREIGQDKFEKYFLKCSEISDRARAKECGITEEQARLVREFVNRAFVQAEFMDKPEAAPSTVFSAVAGIEIEDGIASLSFFHREVWKGVYKVDGGKLEACLTGLPKAEARKARNLISRLEFAGRRKATLYSALEILLNIQSDYLASGEPARRRPLSQKTLAKSLGVDQSVLCRLVSNKSVQMPWGVEAPMTTLLPSPKDINRERLYVIAGENPDWSDKELCGELKRRHGVELSRRSAAQYRSELRLEGKGRRGKGD